ncbi:MAG TPA: hypothetical protein VJN89_07315 [Candidatus Acidoferrum sp.]|nr:hypothetical protein [Candidatus Acidoferrum sp.]
MSKRKWIAAAAGLLVLSAAGYYVYQRRSASVSPGRNDLLQMMPADASAVVFADLAELRSTPFVAQLFAWAPQPEPDEDYAKFLNETGFHYERDLDRLAIAFQKAGQDSAFFAVADGRFDRQKISALANKSGRAEKRGGHEIFAIPESGDAKKIYLTFLSNNRIALTDRADLDQSIGGVKKRSDDGTEEWRSRFERLGGSPVFAVIRQDAAPGEALTERAPGGFSSPQLSTALDQLQWLTFAGKPENDRLHVVAEGESASEGTASQLADLLNGVVALAEAGLNDPKSRQQLDPSLREAYLALLKSADVSKIDRGDTKSVRVAFEITPAFLESARRASMAPAAPPTKPSPGNPAIRSKKGRS